MLKETLFACEATQIISRLVSSIRRNKEGARQEWRTVGKHLLALQCFIWTWLQSFPHSSYREALWSIQVKHFLVSSSIMQASFKYLWLTISTVPYCSIHSFPSMTLCTQQLGLLHVYASLCLDENCRGEKKGRKRGNKNEGGSFKRERWKKSQHNEKSVLEYN